MKRIVIIMFIVSSFQMSYSREYKGSFYSKYSVQETVITEKEYYAAKSDFDKFNVVPTENIDTVIKNKIEQAIVKKLSSKEKLEFYREDAKIVNIGRLPTGDFVADLWKINWLEPVFISTEFNVDMSGINAGVAGVFSGDGMFVGCREFDCDNIAWLIFFKKVKRKSSKMEPFAVYKSNRWKLYIDDQNPIFWNNGFLICKGEENGESRGQIIYLRLELKKDSSNHRNKLRRNK